jgi:hypothetical protein
MPLTTNQPHSPGGPLTRWASFLHGAFKAGPGTADTAGGPEITTAEGDAIELELPPAAARATEGAGSSKGEGGSK